MQPNKRKITRSDAGKWASGSELATELGVSSARLGNWRTRYEDFPSVTTDEKGFILYNREAVLAWKQKRFREEGSVYERSLETLRKLAEALRMSHDVEAFAPLALALLCLVKLGMSPAQILSSDSKRQENARPVEVVVHDLLDDPYLDQETTDSLWDLLKDTELAEVNTLLGMLDSAVPRMRGKWGYPTSPDPLNDLIAKLIVHRDTEVFDPAVGEGRTLLRAAGEIQGTAIGQDVNRRVVQMATMRAFLLDIDADMQLGDSLSDSHSDKKYKVVVADPPMGMKNSADIPSFLGNFGASRMVADWAWIQIVAMNLEKDGEGYVNVISGALFHRMATDVRREMIRRGCIEAVIALPPLSTSARVSSALLCMRAPDIRVGEGVLMIDASDVSSRESGEFVSKIPQVVQLVKNFRNNPESIDNEDNATVVPVLDLLQGDCSLAPAPHIARARKAMGSTVGHLLPLLSDVAKAAQTVSRFKLDSIQRGKVVITHKPLRELRLVDVAMIIQGVRTEVELNKLDSQGQVRSPGSQTVLTVKTLRKPGPLHSVEFIMDQRNSSRAITEPGDIVIARMGDSLAKVDAKGGNLVLAPLSIIRLDPTFDPYIVAAALNSSHVRKMTMSSSGIGRIDLDAVEIPQVSLEDARILRSAIQQMEELEGGIADLGEMLTRARNQAGDFLATADEVVL
jgi:hypothetical protein